METLTWQPFLTLPLLRRPTLIPARNIPSIPHIPRARTRTPANWGMGERGERYPRKRRGFVTDFSNRRVGVKLMQPLVVDTGRGKLSGSVDLREASGSETLAALLRDAWRSGR